MRAPNILARKPQEGPMCYGRTGAQAEGKSEPDVRVRKKLTAPLLFMKFIKGKGKRLT